MQLTERDGPAPAGGDVAGLLEKMRARWRMCVVLTLLGALCGWGYAQLQPADYQAKTSLIIGGVIGGPADQDVLDASSGLAVTYADLIRREPILAPVAARGFADDWQSLQSRVHAQVGDKNPHLVQITAFAPTPAEAERLATAIADRMVALAAERGGTQRSQFLSGELTRIEDQIRETESEIDELQGELDSGETSEDPGEVADQVQDLEKELEEQHQAYADMVSLTPTLAVGADVSVLETAYASSDPLKPNLLSLVVAGAGIGLSIAAGVAHFAGRRRSGPVGGYDAVRARNLSVNGDNDTRSTADLIFDDLASDEPSRPGGRP